ncbi:winged helix-turn-helix domain-containing protein [Thermoactinospora rubra]|uniref:winged helix-turn-helix domain-containing protein n=1 Tax=Thermoactinospora rubra TaxID=1088767 RepID=UPI000A10619D|nr:helix-turn-helix domain-containing protein [Thermoactinospora rubra]
MEHEYVVTDPRVLKAVAHPLRVRLLGLLRADGPATASQLARKVGESSGSTSYHLRELAKYGFIEEAPSGDARERRWRARHRFTTWNSRELSATAEGRDANRMMRERQLEILARAMREYDEADWPAEWTAAVGNGDDMIRLTAEGRAELLARFRALMAEMEQRYGDSPDAEDVYVFIAAYPRKAVL